MFLYQLQRACYYPESYPTVSLLSSLKLFMQWLGVPLSGMLQKGLCSWVNLMTASIAWQIPWTEEPGRLQSMGSLRVGQDWATSISLFTFHFHALEKEMATLSSVLAWRIPGTGESGGLPSMGSHRVRHYWSNLAAAAFVFCYILKITLYSVCCCHSVAQSSPTLCSLMDCSTLGFPVLHYLLKFAQTHVHWVVDAIKSSHPLSPPSPAFNLSQHQCLL